MTYLNGDVRLSNVTVAIPEPSIAGLSVLAGLLFVGLGRRRS